MQSSFPERGNHHMVNALFFLGGMEGVYSITLVGGADTAPTWRVIPDVLAVSRASPTTQMGLSLENIPKCDNSVFFSNWLQLPVWKKYVERIGHVLFSYLDWIFCPQGFALLGGGWAIGRFFKLPNPVRQLCKNAPNIFHILKIYHFRWHKPWIEAFHSLKA